MRRLAWNQVRLGCQAKGSELPRHPSEPVHSRYPVVEGRIGGGLGTATDDALVDWAAEHAEQLLAPLSNHWAHSSAVANRARLIAKAFPAQDREQLIAAAYLHDIGYAPELRRTGCHAIDGASHLRKAGHERLAVLVAHHAEARFEASLRGLDDELAEFSRESSPVADALTYCDMTIGFDGEPLTLDERTREIARRHGEADAVTRSLAWSMPFLSLCVARTERRLRLRGLAP